MAQVGLFTFKRFGRRQNASLSEESIVLLKFFGLLAIVRHHLSAVCRWSIVGSGRRLTHQSITLLYLNFGFKGATMG